MSCEVEQYVDTAALQAQLLRAARTTQREVHGSCAALTQRAEQARAKLLQQAARSRAGQLVPVFMDDMLHRARRLQRLRNELLRNVQACTRQGHHRPQQQSNNNSRSTRQPAGNDTNNNGNEDALQRILSVLEIHCGKEAELTHTRQPSGPTAAQFRVFCRAALAEGQLHTRLQAARAANDDAAQDAVVHTAFALLLDTMNRSAKAAVYGTGKTRGNEARAVQRVVDADANEEASSSSSSGREDENDNKEGEEDVTVCEGTAQTMSYMDLPCLLGLQTYCEDAPWALRAPATQEGHTSALAAMTAAATLGFIFTAPPTTSTSAGSTSRNALRAAAQGRKESNTNSTGTLWGGLQTHRSTAATAFESAETANTTRTTAYDASDSTTTTSNSEDDGSPEGEEQHGDGNRVGLSDDMAQLARVLTEAAVRAVDATWAALDPCQAMKGLRRYTQHPGGSSHTAKTTITESTVDSEVTIVTHPTLPTQTVTSNGAAAAAAAEDDDDEIHIEAEEESMWALMDILRVRYTCELAARMLAVELAKRRLLEKETATVFDAGRVVQLSTHITHDATTTATVKTGSDSNGEDDDSDASLAVRDGEKRMPVLVLQLPGLDLLFYCVAYSVGVALLADYAPHATHHEDDEEKKEEESWCRTFEARYLPDTSRARDAVVHVDVDVDDEEGVAARGCCEAAQDSTSISSSSSSSFALAASLRLWLYLCEYVFTTTVPTATSSTSSNTNSISNNASDEKSREGVTSIVLDRVHAVRWSTRVAAAAVQRGLRRVFLIAHTKREQTRAAAATRCQVGLPPVLAETEKRAREELLRSLAH